MIEHQSPAISSPQIKPTRVVIVDDSPTARELLVSICQETKDIFVVGVCTNGEDAVRLTKRLRPDVVTMDVYMPKLDGLEATRQIMRECPTPIIIVSGSLKKMGVELTFQALQAGALNVIHKPGLDDPDTCQNVIQTIRLMAGVPVIHHWGHAKKGALQSAASSTDQSLLAPSMQPTIDDLRARTDVIGIAASTGGPAALSSLLGALPADFSLPVLIVQHITSGFAAGFAEWLATRTSMRVDVASHGRPLEPGVILLSPDDYHMMVNERGAVDLSKAPGYKGLRPSANHLFSSMARVYGQRAVGVILTGMGDDGVDGLEDLHRAGGYTVAQNKESCVVYGMPGEAVSRKAIDQVIGLDHISALIERLGSPNPSAGQSQEKRA